MMIKDRIQFNEILNIEEQRILIHGNEVNKRSRLFMCVCVCAPDNFAKGIAH